LFASAGSPFSFWPYEETISFIACHSGVASLPLNAVCSTMIGGAVRRGACAWRCTQQGDDAAILGAYDFGTELRQAAFDSVILDDLHALAGVLQRPVFHFRLRQKFAQRDASDRSATFDHAPYPLDHAKSRVIRGGLELIGKC
jgi:hypothetical protein